MNLRDSPAGWGAREEADADPCHGCLSDPAPWLGRQIVVRGDIVGIRPSILVARAEKVAYTGWQDVVSPEEGLHLQFPG